VCESLILKCTLEIRISEGIGVISVGVPCSMSRVRLVDGVKPPTGNARIIGMSTDLHLNGLRYNTAAAVFFVRLPLYAGVKFADAPVRYPIAS
jgi:hypothetical protein